MEKVFYDEVPFSGDHNYDTLTDSEAGQVFELVKGSQKSNKQLCYRTGAICVLWLVLLIMIAYVTIAAENWRMVWRIIPNAVAAVSFVWEIRFGIRLRNRDEKFLIAKGTIADIRTYRVVPDNFHPDGEKAVLTAAVSDSETLPGFDVTSYRYDDLIIGDTIVVVNFPEAGPMYRFLYRSWL